MDKKITYSIDEQIKAKSFVECLDPDSLTFMVKHMLSEHSDIFLPMITFKEVKI